MRASGSSLRWSRRCGAWGGGTRRPRARRPSRGRTGRDAGRPRDEAALDEARDALRVERTQTAGALAALAAATALLLEQQHQHARADAVADGYSAALTQLLVPDSLGDR